MKPYGFIYITTNTTNGKRYVGQSKKDPKIAYFGSGKAIRRALLKYGESMFIREIIMFAFSRKDLDFLEEYFIAEFNAVKDRSWYNISPAPNVTAGFKGKKHTQEWKDARAEFGRTRSATDKMRENMAKLGKLPRNENQLAASVKSATKMGLANTGRKHSKEIRAKQSASHKGKSRGVVYTIQTPTGIIMVDCLKDWCRDHNINYSSLRNTIGRKFPMSSGYQVLQKN